VNDLLNKSYQNDGIQLSTHSLVQKHKSSALWLQTLLDQLMVVGLLTLHTIIKTGEFDTSYRALAVATVLVMAIVYSSTGLYTQRLNTFSQLWLLARSWGLVIVILIFFGFITKTSGAYSREVILTWIVTGFLMQTICYHFVLNIQKRAHKEIVPSLLVGSQKLGKHLVQHINNNAWIPDRFVGVVERTQGFADDWNEPEVPVVGVLDDISNLVAEYKIKRIYIALPMQDAELIKPIYLNLVNQNIDIIWAPDIFGVNLLNHSIKEIAGVPLISLSESPLVGTNALTKSLLDRTIASIALVLLSPLMLLIAMIIKMTSKGPVFFKQNRHGFDGKIIEIWKFRSMQVHEEVSDQVTQATKGDARVTAIGAFIRKTSIDELPQLGNVLMGNMSLVGPRPHAVAHNDHYRDKIDTYMARHRILPGLTGLAQVNGFRGETDTLEKMEGRVQYDLAYINNWSVWLDIQIMIKTVFVLLSKNAY